MSPSVSYNRHITEIPKGDSMEKVKIKVVVQAKPVGVPGWPHINYNYEKKTKEVMDCVRAYNPDAEFDVFQYSYVEEAEKAYEEDMKNYDGIFLLLITNWRDLDHFYAQKSKNGLPCAIAAVEYCGSGSILLIGSTIKKNNLPVPTVSSSDLNDIARLARVLVVNAKLKKSSILIIRNDVQDELQKKATERFGVSFVNRNSVDLMKMFDEVDENEALEVVKKWTNNAVAVLEPSHSDILESAKLYIAIRRMTEEVNASAVTIDCLTLSYNDDLGKNRHMYPCLSHFQMMEDGGLGVCEADIDSTIASLMVLYTTGRYGFVSDPVIDTSSDRIIYAHCVACRKVLDVNDPRICEYYIRSHAEDQMGASVQVIFPEGEKLTTVNVYNAEDCASIHSSVSIGNAGNDAGCRSKLVAKCNSQKILENWMPIWHRVTVYGDYRKDFMDFFKLKSLNVIEEDV